MKEEVTEAASGAVGPFLAAVTQWKAEPDGLGCDREMETAKPERGTGNMGSVGPLSQKAKPALGFHTSRNHLSLAVPGDQMSPSCCTSFTRGTTWPARAGHTMPTGTSMPSPALA